MIKLYIKLNDSDLTFKITAKQGHTVLKEIKGGYKRDLADKIIKGLDKILTCVNIGKRDNFRAYYDFSSKSFVSNLIVNSVVNIFNWLQRNNRVKGRVI
jgi:hypothetical protein